jgi:hypothetical protein
MPNWMMFLFVLLLGLLFLVGIFLIDHGLALAGWIWLAVSAGIGIAVYEVPRFQIRQGLKSNPSSQGEIVYVFDDRGCVVTFATGESRLDWNAYTKCKETGTSFLLFFSPHRYALIPKRVMSAEQIEEFRGLLKTKIPGR